MNRERYFLGGWISATVLSLALEIADLLTNDNLALYMLLTLVLAVVFYLIGTYATERIVK